MIADSAIDEALMAHVGYEWRKVAFVAGMAMQGMDAEQRAGRDDGYFANRIRVLSDQGH